MPRGTVRTPAFMPVGTGGTVKAMYMDQVRELGADIILGNTYHLMLRPGAERVARLGGLHEFARWPWPILTDSGGFQVMSLAALAQARRERRGLPVACRRKAVRDDAGAIDRDPGPARLRHPDAARRVRAPARRAGRSRTRDGAFPALGRALQARLRRAAGKGDVRHRAGRRRRAPARTVGGGAGGDGPQGLCRRRPCRRRAAGGDAGDARRDLPGASATARAT